MHFIYTGEKGIWIFPLFDEKNPPRNYAATCKKWKKQQDIITPHPSCPCTYTQALFDKRLHMDTTTSCAELISPTPQGYGVVRFKFYILYENTLSKVKNVHL